MEGYVAVEAQTEEVLSGSIAEMGVVHETASGTIVGSGVWIVVETETEPAIAMPIEIGAETATEAMSEAGNGIGAAMGAGSETGAEIGIGTETTTVTVTGVGEIDGDEIDDNVPVRVDR